MWQKIKSWWARPAQISPLLLAVNEAALQPELYLAGGVSDNFAGRYEMLCVQMAKTLAAGRALGTLSQAQGQALIEAMLDQLEYSLREDGVGDMGVPKRMRKMVEGFYGRATAYQDAFLAQDKAALILALQRNVWADGSAHKAHAEKLADIIWQQWLNEIKQVAA